MYVCNFRIFVKSDSCVDNFLIYKGFYGLLFCVSKVWISHYTHNRLLNLASQENL